jgi:putative acetyltransferase
MIAVRPERPGEQDGVFAIHAAAFETDLEARLADRLRADGDVLLSLMALDGDEPVGNLILSLMHAQAEGEPLKAAAIGPIGVRPDRQGEGIGSALMRACIEWARGEGFAAIFLLGSPNYYGRFGFSAEAAAPFASPYAGPYFQALMLDDTFVVPKSGRADYAPAFAAFED